MIGTFEAGGLLEVVVERKREREGRNLNDSPSGRLG